VAFQGQLGKLGVQVGIELSGLITQRAEVLDDPWILGRKHGQDLMTNTNPLEGALVIRWVVEERKRPLLRVRPHVGTTAIEQRADDPVGTPSLDPPEAAEPGTTQHPRKHRFCLIVLGVADRNTARTVGEGHLLKSSIPKVARSSLDRDALPREIDARSVEGHAELARKRSHLLHLQNGLGPEAVVDRCGAKRDAELAS